MNSSGFSDIYLFAAAAIVCVVLAMILTLLTSRHREKKEAAKSPSILRCLLSGDSLSETGLRYRIAVFIALMFAFMNTVATVVIFLASQMKP